MSYLRYLCLLAYSVFQNIWCCVFFIFVVALFVFILCFVYPVLTISQDCPFLIAPSVFSNVYLVMTP